jgi:autotransporter-associated beta strand protein
VQFPAAGTYVVPIDLGPSIFGNQIDVRDITFSGLTSDVTLKNTIPGGVLRIYGNFTGGAAGTGIITSGGTNHIVTIENDLVMMNNGVLLNSDPTSAAQVYMGTLRTAVNGGRIVLTGRSNSLSPAITVHGAIRNGLNGEITRLDTGYTPDGTNHRAIARVTNDTSDFTGWVWVKTNTLQFSSVSNLGSPSSLGRGGLGDDAMLWLGDSTHTGTLDYISAAPAGHSTDRVIQLYGTSGGGTILANGVGPLVLNGNVVNSLNTTLNKNFTLGGDNTADNRLYGAIGSAMGTGVVNLVKSGISTWSLTAANSYDGATTVAGGRLRLIGAGAQLGSSTTGVQSLNIASGATFELDGGSVYATDLNLTAGGSLEFGSGFLSLRSNNTTGGVNGNITVGTAGAGVLQLSGGSQNFANVTLHGADDTLDISAGGTYAFFNLDNSVGGQLLANGANIQINGGNLTHMVPSGSSTIRSGIQGSGGLIKRGAGTLVLDGATSHTYTGSTSVSGGTLKLVGGSAHLSDTTLLSIAPGATFDISEMNGGEVVGPIVGFGTVVSGLNRPFGTNMNSASSVFGGRVTGPGAFIRRGIGQLVLTGDSDFSGDFQLDHFSEITQIGSGGSVSGPANVSIGEATLFVNGGTLETPGRIFFTTIGTGPTLRLDSGLVKANQIDRRTFGGTIVWNGGTVHLTSGIRIQSGTIAVDTPFQNSLGVTPNRTLIVDGTVAINNGGTLSLSGGSITADALAFSGSGDFNFTAGTLRLRANQTFDAMRIAQYDLSSPLGASRELVIDGSLTLSSTMVLNGGTLTAASVSGMNHLVMNAGTLNILAGDIVTDAAVPQINVTNTLLNVGGQLNNQRALNLIGTDTTFAAPSINGPTGEINSIGSILDFPGGLSNSGVINMIDTTILGNVHSAPTGTTTYAGTNSVGGDLTMAPADLLRIQIAGESPTQFDALNVGGEAFLSGTLHISLAGGYQPSAGSTFELVTATDGLAGAFATTLLPSLAGGLSWDVDYRPNSLTVSVLGNLMGDFNGDGSYDCLDVDALVQDVAAGLHTSGFDLTGDGLVNTADLDEWLTLAGGHNLASGNAYLYGDANLDGAVDGSDFNLWNGSKFTATAAWCQADFNADGSVDGSDFNLWNNNKFTSADSTGTVPEPVAEILMLLALLLFSHRRGN